MEPQPTTEGEILFQKYLISQGHAGLFEFEQPCPGKKRVVDYTLTHAGKKCLFDVKDFAPDIFPVGEAVGAYSFDPYPRIREKIEQGREKFKEYKGLPCGLVLRNTGNFHVSLEDTSIMLGAMYGDAGISIPIGKLAGSAPAVSTFLGRGKMIRPKWKTPQNTTISALITLRHVNVGQMKLSAYIKRHPELGRDLEKILQLDLAELGIDLEDRQLGVIVWENGFATAPFPRELFQGKYDVRWGIVGDSQQMIFRGEGLTEL